MKKNSVIPAAVTGILLAAVILVPVPGRERWITVLHDFAHAPIFGCVAVAVLLILRASDGLAKRPAWQLYLLALAVAVVLGALTEIIQWIEGRDASWIDLRSDIIGAAAFLGLCAAFDRTFTPRVRAAGIVVAIALLVWHSKPGLDAIRAYQYRASLEPTLAQFSTARDLYFIDPLRSHARIEPLPSDWSSTGDTALRVDFTNERWPGVDFFEPFTDWSRYRTLELDLVNPGDSELRLTLRIHDVNHNNEYADRFNRDFALAPRSRQVVSIPLADIESAPRDRRMNMTRIADLHLFRSDGSSGERMYVVKMAVRR
ncbi:hypothetical protein HNQ60_000224 [Povalibacter uvarum]|uniref:VanZ like family protein n=1 Tax=Povalibacter uvarum TaxID=732238 RepID=A0A841HGF1_9GAMM|nr:VanZ family protein [Povalibacter uvarum]MBB6091378.1 hypothetical protein [Povalibacter uvarum]